MWHGSGMWKFMGSFLYRSKCYPSLYSFLFLLSSWNIVWWLELQHPSCNHAEIKDILLQKSQLWHPKTTKARPSNCLLLDPLLYVWALWRPGWIVDSGSAGPAETQVSVFPASRVLLGLPAWATLWVARVSVLFHHVSATHAEGTLLHSLWAQLSPPASGELPAGFISLGLWALCGVLELKFHLTATIPQSHLCRWPSFLQISARRRKKQKKS